MPRSKTGRRRDLVDPQALKNAIAAVNSDDPNKKLSYREASKVFKVSRSTITRHLNKFKELGESNFEYSVNYAVKKVFTELEENSLVNYIQTVAKMQYGLTKKGVRQLAYKFAKANSKTYPKTWDDEQIAGEEWMRGFLNRHSKTLSIRKPEATSLSRATSFNRYNIGCFFKNLKDVHDRFGPIPPERIWNLDETGLSTVQGQSKIVAPKGVKQIGSATSAERGHLVTMIAAVNAVGNSLPPMLIFPRVHFKDRMLFGGPPGCIGSANITGWSNKETFLKFLDHFLNSVKCCKEERMLLVLDNHETHLSIEALERASAAGVVIVTFPPHTSHKLQPLDLSVYSPLKNYYNQAVETWLYNHKGNTFDIYAVAEALGAAYPKAFTPSNILSGFRKSGICPFDPDIFTDDDYLSAYVTDRDVQQPSTDLTVRLDTTEEKTNRHSTSTSMVLDESNPGPSNDAQRGANEPIPGTSSNVQPSTIGYISCNTKQTIKTPEQIQPYPKAEQRKKSTKGRKAGKTMIATDTPEKEIIKKQKETSSYKKKREVVKKNISKTLLVIKRKSTEPTKLLKSKKKTAKESSSESEDDPPNYVSTDDDDSADEECLYCRNSKEADRSGEQWCRCVGCGRWTHYLCAGVEGNSWKTYLCDFCTSR